MRTESKSKRAFWLGLSLGVYCFDRMLGAVRSAFGRRSPARCVVLFYHSIPADLRIQFARQMEAVRRHAQPISAAHNSSLERGSRYVVVTFDDAFETVVQNAIPEMVARSIPATIFVVTECMGRLPNWMETDSRTMSIDQLLNLPDSVTVGSHTATHPVLPQLGAEEAKREIVESRRMLEKVLGRRVGLFSFPHGAHNAALIRACREAGYDRVFTIEPVLGLTRPDEFVTGRVSVEASDWPLEFHLKMVGAYRCRSLTGKVRRLLKRRGQNGA